ncbi:hypothetical protein I4F81_008624 [Pyropia yezoensis]|uniref:Uncharacterized protein n=1 Tax=Pyropia yezoensis TaxID=2788 RepID=A0ACC3C715_PYRYE|nr:hypothetical protein I4F81_008624 [Neopyropia yezoensis]
MAARFRPCRLVQIPTPTQSAPAPAPTGIIRPLKGVVVVAPLPCSACTRKCITELLVPARLVCQVVGHRLQIPRGFEEPPRHPGQHAQRLSDVRSGGLGLPGHAHGNNLRGWSASGHHVGHVSTQQCGLIVGRLQQVLYVCGLLCHPAVEVLHHPTARARQSATEELPLGHSARLAILFGGTSSPSVRFEKTDARQHVFVAGKG